MSSEEMIEVLDVAALRLERLGDHKTASALRKSLDVLYQHAGEQRPRFTVDRFKVERVESTRKYASQGATSDMPCEPIDFLADVIVTVATKDIPLLPGFELLLLETSEEQRFGWVLNPMSLQTKLGRTARHQRPDAEWVGKVITRIGKAAGIVVQPAKGVKKEKYASAHDLRRGCAKRLKKEGLRLEEIALLLRHADIKTTENYYAGEDDVQESASVIRQRLGVPRYTVVA